MQPVLPVWVLLAGAVLAVAGLVSVGGLLVLWLTRKKDEEGPRKGAG